VVLAIVFTVQAAIKMSMMMMMMTQLADSDGQLSQVEFLCQQVDLSATWHVSDLTMSRGEQDYWKRR